MIRQNKILPGIVASPLKKGIPKPVADTSCKYKPRTCHQPVLENYDYCLKHILEDKSAPFRPCNYVYPSNNKRCFMPARQLDKVENRYVFFLSKWVVLYLLLWWAYLITAFDTVNPTTTRQTTTINELDLMLYMTCSRFFPILIPK